MLPPAEFAFEHFGKKIHPQSRDAWMNSPAQSNKGNSIRPIDGAHIFISEDEIVTFGVSYPQAGIIAKDIDGDVKWRDFKNNLLFNPPNKAWMSVSFGKSGLKASSLVLNTNTSQATILEKSGNVFVTTKPQVMQDVSELIKGFPMAKLGTLMKLHSKSKFSGNSDSILSDNEVAELSALYGILGQKQTAKAMNLLINNEVNIYSLKNYIEWKAENNV